MQFQQCITSLKINCKDLMALGLKVIVGVIVSVGMIEIVRVTAAVIAGVIVGVIV